MRDWQNYIEWTFIIILAIPVLTLTNALIFEWLSYDFPSYLFLGWVVLFYLAMAFLGYFSIKKDAGKHEDE